MSKKNIPILIDLDGVLRIDDKPANDANDFLQFLNEEKIPTIILSNSTLSSGNDVKHFFMKIILNLIFP
ncbi:MAG: hypothetical protein ACYCVH_04710 [Ignavibacteriaceae bacterium]